MEREELCCEAHELHEDQLELVSRMMPAETELYDLAELFKTFGDSTRIRILFVLFEAEVCVCDLAQVLNMTADEAVDFFAAVPQAAAILKAMQELGLGYLPLDRSVTTLSGGESQRVKLASYLAKAAPKRSSRPGENLLIVLDEPSTGLHFGELDMLLRAIYRLRAAGHTILCIEHNQGVLSRADYLVELGPGSGDEGGRITYAGEPV